MSRGPHPGAARRRVRGRAVPDHPPGDRPIDWAEVVGFDGDGALLMAYGGTDGLRRHDEVAALGRSAEVETSDAILGCVVDYRGRVLLRKAPGILSGVRRPRPLRSASPPSLTRRPVTRTMATGVAVIDALHTVGEGQRMAIVGAAGLGKSSLISQLVRGAADVDVVVIGLVGERGREVQDFVQQLDSLESWRRCVMVASTSDRPAVERNQFALAALTIAEAHRAEGRQVLLVLDSLTRVARALRELGLARAEPPTRRGFPASVFAELPGSSRGRARTPQGRSPHSSPSCPKARRRWIPSSRRCAHWSTATSCLRQTLRQRDGSRRSTSSPAVRG